MFAAGLRAARPAHGLARRQIKAEHELTTFIRRAAVRAQYREMVRLARDRAKRDGGDVLRQVQAGYRRHRGERDSFAVAQLIAEGRSSLRELRALADDDGGPSAEYEVGVDWPWAAGAAAPARPLGLPKR